MKAIKLIALLALLGLVSAGAFYLGTTSTHQSAKSAMQNAAGSEEKTLYTCGMHPNVIQDHPGTCPICEMKLTPIRRGGGAPAGSGTIKYYKSTMIPGEVRQDPGKDSMGMEMMPVYESEAAMDAAISIDPVTIQNMGIRTEVLTNGPLRRIIRTVGTVDYDETALTDVTTKFTGWVEKLYVDATGAQVHRGDPLFEVYSPDLYSAQMEYVLALSATSGKAGGESSLLETAGNKLRYWDISDDQITELRQTRRPQKTLQVKAPMDGFVVEKMVVDGQMVEAGMRLYRLADLGLVWVHAQIYEQDLPFIKLGQEAAVNLSYLPDRKFRGRVTYIYPDLDPKTRTAQVRMEFHNPGYFLKPAMFASVEIASELSPSVLLVPEMAVLRSGAKNTVFVVREGGKFEPRTVTLGSQAEDDMLQVLGGLKAGDRVVVSGQFMLDSESQLREAIQKMLDPASSTRTRVKQAEDTNSVHDHAAHKPPSDKGVMHSVYLCPMPEHVAIEYDHPGECPLCGMSLVPVSKDLLRKMQPGGAIEYYTCPMPEHADLKLDKPGKCPLCRMTLIPVMSKPLMPRAKPTVAPSEASLPTLYTCPMASHAHIVTDQPGRCPECDMQLVETTTVEHGQTSETIWRAHHQHPQAH
ncbi:MAG: efflux RND transporter periplasmic adaptor subunit [Verrucomicrobia bacterium]|nr:efflux RND transporter periplasmic adaptor subunit [Verrucomicrobiota bacterium]